MNKKTYLQPRTDWVLNSTLRYICGDNSLPYGGEDGPGIAESKERDEELPVIPDQWGDLW